MSENNSLATVLIKILVDYQQGKPVMEAAINDISNLQKAGDKANADFKFKIIDNIKTAQTTSITAVVNAEKQGILDIQSANLRANAAKKAEELNNIAAIKSAELLKLAETGTAKQKASAERKAKKLIDNAEIKAQSLKDIAEENIKVLAGIAEGKTAELSAIQAIRAAKNQNRSEDTELRKQYFNNEIQKTRDLNEESKRAYKLLMDSKNAMSVDQYKKEVSLIQENTNKAKSFITEWENYKISSNLNISAKERAYISENANFQRKEAQRIADLQINEITKRFAKEKELNDAISLARKTLQQIEEQDLQRKKQQAKRIQEEINQQQIDGIKLAQAAQAKADKEVSDNKKRALEDEKLRSIENLTSTIQAGTAALTAFYVALKAIAVDNSFVEASSKYEVHLRNFNSLAQETEEQLKLTHEAIKGMVVGENLVGMAESAKTLQHIESSGYHAAGALNILEESSRTAYSGLADMFKVADAGTSILKAYGKEAGEIANINNINAKTVQYGKVTFDQLNSVIGTAISLAPEAKVRYEEVAAAISTITAQGVKADIAVTEVNALIKGVFKPSVEGKALGESLGIDLSSANLALKGLGGVVDEIFQKTAKFGDQQNTVISKLLGDIREIKGLFKLHTGDMALYNEMLGHMEDDTDQVSLALKEQMKTFDYHRKALSFTTEALNTEFGFLIQKTFIPFLKLLNEIIKAFIDLPEPVKKVIESIILIGGAIITLTLTIGGLIMGGKALIAIFGANGLVAALNGATVATGGLTTATATATTTAGIWLASLGAVALVIEGLIIGYETLKVIQEQDRTAERWKTYNDDIDRARESLKQLLAVEEQRKLHGGSLSLEEKTDLAHTMVQASKGKYLGDDKFEANDDSNSARIKELSLQIKQGNEEVVNHKKVEDEKNKITYDSWNKKLALQKSGVENMESIEKNIREAGMNERNKALDKAKSKFDIEEKQLQAIVDIQSNLPEGSKVDTVNLEKAKNALIALRKARKDEEAKITQEYDEKDKKKAEADREREIRLLKKGLEAKVNIIRENINEVNALEDITNAEKLRRINKFLSQEAALYRNYKLNKNYDLNKTEKENENAKLLTDSKGKVIKFDADDTTGFGKLAAKDEAEQQKNRTKIVRENVTERLMLEKLAYDTQKNDLQVFAKQNHQQNYELLNNQIALDKSRLQSIEDTLDKEWILNKLTFEQEKALIKEKIALKKSIPLDQQSKTDEKFQADQEYNLKEIEFEQRHAKALLAIHKQSLDENYQVELDNNQKLIDLAQKQLDKDIKDRPLLLTPEQQAKDPTIAADLQKLKDLKDKNTLDSFNKEQNLQAIKFLGIENEKRLNDQKYKSQEISEQEHFNLVQQNLQKEYEALQALADKKDVDAVTQLERDRKASDKKAEIEINNIERVKNAAKTIADPVLAAFEKILPGVTKIFDELVGKNKFLQEEIVKTALGLGNSLGIPNLPSLSDLGVNGNASGTNQSLPPGSPPATKSANKNPAGLSKEMLEFSEMSESFQKEFDDMVSSSVGATQKISDSMNQLTESTNTATQATKGLSLTSSLLDMFVLVGSKMADSFKEAAENAIKFRATIQELDKLRLNISNLPDSDKQRQQEDLDYYGKLYEFAVKVGASQEQLLIIQNKAHGLDKEKQVSLKITENEQLEYDKIRLAHIENQINIERNAAQKSLQIQQGLRNSVLGLVADSLEKEMEMIENSYLDAITKILTTPGLSEQEVGDLSQTELNLKADKENKARVANAEKEINIEANLRKSIIAIQADSLAKSLSLIEVDKNQTLDILKLKFEAGLILEKDYLREVGIARNNALEKSNQAIISENKSNYDKVLSIVADKEKAKLDLIKSNIDSELKIRENAAKKFEDLARNRTYDENEKKERLGLFKNDIANQSGQKTSAFYRQNELNFNTVGTDGSGGNEQQRVKTQNDYALGLIDYETMRQQRQKEGMDKYLYYLNQANLLQDPKAKQEAQQKAIDGQKEYYEFILDAEKEKLAREQKQNDEDLAANQLKLKTEESQYQSLVDSVDAMFKDSAGNMKTSYVTEFRSFINGINVDIQEIGVAAYTKLMEFKKQIATDINNNSGVPSATPGAGTSSGSKPAIPAVLDQSKSIMSQVGNTNSSAGQNNQTSNNQPASNSPSGNSIPVPIYVPGIGLITTNIPMPKAPTAPTVQKDLYGKEINASNPVVKGGALVPAGAQGNKPLISSSGYDTNPNSPTFGLRAATNTTSSRRPSYASGIPQTREGEAYLHDDEMVIPPKSVNNAIDLFRLFTLPPQDVYKSATSSSVNNSKKTVIINSPITVYGQGLSKADLMDVAKATANQVTDNVKNVMF